MAPGAALGKSGQESEPGAEHLEKFESFYNEEAMGLHDSGFLLGKEKGKSLGKEPWQKQAQQAKASGLAGWEVDPPTDEPQSPSEEQILAQTRKQPWCTISGGAGPNLGKGQEQALQKEADHSTGPPCCLEKGRGPAAGQLEEGLLEKAAALAKAAREKKKELSHFKARAPSGFGARGLRGLTRAGTSLAVTAAAARLGEKKGVCVCVCVCVCASLQRRSPSLEQLKTAQC